MTAKTYNILGENVYLYRRVCDEIGMPKDHAFRRQFHKKHQIGEWGTDKIVINDSSINEAIQGEDYKYNPRGYMYITEDMKEQLKTAYRLHEGVVA